MTTRIITAIAILAFLAVLVRFIPDWGLALCCQMVFLLALLEWARIAKMNEMMLSLAVVIFIIFSMPSILGIVGIYDQIWPRWLKRFEQIALIFGFVFWVVIAPLLLRKKINIIKDAIGALIGGLSLGIAMMAMIYLLSRSVAMTVAVILIPSLVDICAYFVGKFFGSTPFSAISPNKTLEGVIGGVAFGSMFGAILLVYFASMPYFLGFVTAIVLSLVAITGDLFESLAKRYGGVKDSGHFLPGHGGFLDRIDSHIAVLPTFCGILLMWK